MHVPACRDSYRRAVLILDHRNQQRCYLSWAHLAPPGTAGAVSLELLIEMGRVLTAPLGEQPAHEDRRLRWLARQRWIIQTNITSSHTHTHTCMHDGAHACEAQASSRPGCAHKTVRKAASSSSSSHTAAVILQQQNVSTRGLLTVPPAQVGSRTRGWAA